MAAVLVRGTIRRELPGLAWPVLDHYQYYLSPLWWLAMAMPAGALQLYLIGKFSPPPQRVLAYVLIIGVFGYRPLAIGLLLLISTLLFLPPAASGWLITLCTAYAALPAFWIGSEVGVLRTKLVKSRYLEPEFKARDNFIFASRAPKTDLEAVPGPEASANGRMARWLLPKLVLVVPIAYPLQKMITGQGGTPAILLFLAIVCTPFASYVLCRMACEGYLWICTVWKLERQHGKNVLLSKSS